MGCLSSLRLSSRLSSLYLGGLVLLIGIATPFLSYGQVLRPYERVGGLRVSGNLYTGSVLYRPSSAQYRFWDGEKFDLVYQDGTGDMARRTRQALQSAWPQVDSLVGPVSPSFDTPVVVTGYTDLGGGRVRAFPFYQEVDAVSSKSSELVARSSTWPALVAPHELVHSAHVDVDAGIGVGGLVRPFAPDWARGLNAAYPPGVGEGAAVYLESSIEDEAGRLHSPFFTMKMKAAMLSDDPWSLTQMLSAPAYTRPRDRYYIGGAHTFQYLAERGDTTSTEFFHDAVTWQNRLPFLGFGLWLGVGADQFPHRIGSEVQRHLQELYASELDSRRPFTPLTRVAADDGLYHRRPYWIDEETLVAYVSGYDVRAGFYKIDARTGQRSPLRIQTLMEDRRYSIGRDTSALYASRYVPNPWAPSQRIAEIERIDLQSGDATRLTRKGRAGAPVEGPEQIHAVKYDGPFTRWGVVQGDSVRSRTSAHPSTIREIAPAPGEGPIAVLKNVNGDQRLYRSEGIDRGEPQMKPWIGLDDAVIYDMSWGPEGRYLLFSADHPEAPNIFAFDRTTDRVLQLATVPFGAREPTLSPDGSTLAFVNYDDEQYDLVRMPFRPDSATVLPDSVVTLGGPAPSPPGASDPSVADNQSEPYSAWRHLGPDAIYPTLRDSPLEWDEYVGENAAPLAPGLTISGADPLRQWAYRGFLFWQDGRVWGEARVESGRFLLRPSISTYNRPVVASSDSSSGLEERGVGVGVRLPITLRSNVYQTALQFGFETQLRQTRKYQGGLTGVSPYGPRLTLKPRMGLRYRLQRNPRDVIPNTGVSLVVEGTVDPWMEKRHDNMTERRQALRAQANLYLPFLRRWNTGLRLGARVLAQNQVSYDPLVVLPRGYGELPGSRAGTFLRLGGEVIQPLWYIDDGMTLLPLYFEALSVYGFGQTLGRVSVSEWEGTKRSVGGGVALDTRLFYRLSLRLRVGLAYRIEEGDVKPTFR